VSHVKSDYEPLDGTLELCESIEGVRVDLSIKCIDRENLLLGLHGSAVEIDAEKHTQEFTLPEVLNPGDLLMFDHLADVTTVVAEVDWLVTPTGQTWRRGWDYAVNEIGIEILRCIYVPDLAPSNSVLTVNYKCIDATKTMAGEGSRQDVKLIYKGVNAFDGTAAILVIPQVRFDPVDSFEFITSSEGEIAIQGAAIPQSSSPRWYSLTRPQTGC
jgi:hypothetical protein